MIPPPSGTIASVFSMESATDSLSTLANNTAADPPSNPKSKWISTDRSDWRQTFFPQLPDREEVLLEIVESEERYIRDLKILKELFIDPLLHPSTNNSAVTPRDYAIESQYPIIRRPFSSPSSADILSASRPFKGTKPRAASLYGASTFDDEANNGGASARSSNDPRRNSYEPVRNESNRFLSVRTLQRRRNSKPSTSIHIAGPTSGYVPISLLFSKFSPDESILPFPIPKALKFCLQSIEGIIKDHRKLSQELRDCYETEHLSSRGVAQIFVSHPIAYDHYAEYLLRFDTAIKQADVRLAEDPPRPHSHRVITDSGTAEFSNYLSHLYEIAASRGQPHLHELLWKPFRRLFMYPLLFRNLLYYTEPSAPEHEIVSEAMARVESIVQRLEETKSQTDDLTCTIDTMERIRGLAFAPDTFPIHQPGRVLIAEKPYHPNAYIIPEKGPPNLAEKSVGKKDDIWMVTFNDVILRCQRTGLCLTAYAIRGNSYLRQAQGTWKNVYKYIAVETVSTKVPPPRFRAEKIFALAAATAELSRGFTGNRTQTRNSIQSSSSATTIFNSDSQSESINTVFDMDRTGRSRDDLLGSRALNIRNRHSWAAGSEPGTDTVSSTSTLVRHIDPFKDRAPSFLETISDSDEDQRTDDGSSISTPHASVRELEVRITRRTEEHESFIGLAL